MKTTFTTKLVRLTLFVSLLASCTPKPEKKGVEQNHYLDQVVENHIVVREAIQEFGESAPAFRDTIQFIEHLFPLRRQIMELQSAMDTIARETASDTLILGSSDELFKQYNSIIHNDFKVLFEVYIGQQGELSEEDKKYIESMWSFVKTRDEESLATFFHFAKLSDEQKAKLTPLKQ